MAVEVSMTVDTSAEDITMTASAGVDGFSPTASVTKDGSVATITITDKTGTTTASVSDGATGATGADGADGHTPVRGTDYWTAADVAAIEGDVRGGIQVGGRNLLTKASLTTPHVIQGRSITNVQNGIDLTVDAGVSYTYSWMLLPTLVVGTKYVFTATIGATGQVNYGKFALGYGTNVDAAYQYGVAWLSPDPTERRVTFAFTAAATDLRLLLYPCASATPTTATAEMWAHDVKLEHGTIATDWTPAVEDVAAGISAAQTTATDAATAAAGDLAQFHTELGGKADLVDGLVPAAQLPSFVDDVLEYPTLADFPATGESGKIYTALDANKTYRWGGTVYVFLGGDLAIGETASTAFRGDHGKTAYDHSQATGNPHSTTPTDIGLVPLAKTVYGESDYGGTLSANLDTITHNGFYTCYTGTPGLSAEMTTLGISWHVLHQNSNVGTGDALQTATGFSASGVIEYKRVKVSGTWGAWTKSLASSAVHAIESVTTLPASPTATTLYLVG